MTSAKACRGSGGQAGMRPAERPFRGRSPGAVVATQLHLPVAPAGWRFAGGYHWTQCPTCGAWQCWTVGAPLSRLAARCCGPDSLRVRMAKRSA
jgi:hypothetical protein